MNKRKHHNIFHIADKVGEMEFYPLKLKSVVSWKIGRKSRKIDTTKERSIDDTMWTLIKEDKWESFENILLDLDTDRKEALLNGSSKVIPTEVDGKGKVRWKDRIYSLFKKKDKGLHDDSRPLFQCVTFGSFNILKVLLKHGANILQVAENQWNIIHYLIAVSHENEKFESKAVNIFKRLLGEVDTEDVHKLLMMEDINGLRPLELAVHAGCLQMFNAIINTPGVYLVHRQRKGLKEVSWYDITEYEDVRFWNKTLRQSKSPINLLSYSERKVLKSDISIHMLRKGMLKQWMRRKFMCNAPFICIWFWLRLIFVVAFYYMISVDIEVFIKQVFILFYRHYQYTYSENNLVNKNNISQKHCDCNLTNETFVKCPCTLKNLTETVQSESDTQDSVNCVPFTGWYITAEQFRSSHRHVVALLGNIGYLCIYIACSLVFDVLSVITWFCSNSCKWKYFLGKKKDIIASSTFYRICHFMFTLFIFLIMREYIESALKRKDYMNQIVLKVGLIFTCFLSIWSVLYFVQLIPSLGQFVNSIRRMLGVMFNFIIVYLLMLYPYPHAFMVMLKNSSGCQVPGFETLQGGIYSSFKVMLNMLDISTYQSGKEKMCNNETDFAII